LIGVHEVVGAFLAGLAINATLPRHSPVTGHVLFIGESFFIPVFLLYSGMITDPATVLSGWKTLLVALGVTIVAYVSKLAASWLTGKIFKYTRDEFWTVYGLSHAQAAVTIPTLVIGLQIGLFDKTLFNAAILMILFTSITSPMLVQRFAPRLQQAQPEEKASPLFSRILVPITNPQTQEHLVTLASLLARTAHGKVMALNVVRDAEGQVPGLNQQRELLGRVPEIVGDPEAEIELIPRLAGTFAQGILHTSIERDASLIVMGWRGRRTLSQSILGTVLDEVIWGSDTPVLIGKLSQPLNATRRVLLVLPPNVLAPSVLRRMLDANFTLARALNVPLLILSDPGYMNQVQELLGEADLEQPVTLEALRGPIKPREVAEASPNDLLVVPGFGSRQRFMASIGNLPEQLASAFDGNLVILHFDR
jgi:nucleotide-binding universal stress UspA family protein